MRRQGTESQASNAAGNRLLGLHEAKIELESSTLTAVQYVRWQYEADTISLFPPICFRIVAAQPFSFALPLQRRPHILAFPWREWSRSRPCFHPHSASAGVSNCPSRRRARQYGSRALIRLKVSAAI